MKKAIYSTIERWGWECPECGEWHEEDDDPGYEEELYCGNCENSFEPVEG